jgi:hypothetical protein
MDLFEAGEWESRLKAYQHILDLMRDPSHELLVQLQRDLPISLADIHPACQAVVLLIGDVYLKRDFDGVNYSQIATVLIS